jgi:hypothetical protein
MNVSSKYGLLRIAGVLLIILAIVFAAACIIGGITLPSMLPDFGMGGTNILTIILVVLGLANGIAWIVKGTELMALDDVEKNTRANQQAIERVMRLTEVQVTGSGSSTQPLPTMDR